MSKRSLVFKCIESDEHVLKANVQTEDVLGALGFFVHFSIPTDMPYNYYSSEAERLRNNMHLLHDLAHRLAENLVIAYDSGSAMLQESFWINVIEDVRKQQDLCKGGR